MIDMISVCVCVCVCVCVKSKWMNTVLNLSKYFSWIHVKHRCISKSWCWMTDGSGSCSVCAVWICLEVMQRASLSMYTMHTRRLHTLLADWTVSMVTITGFCSLCYRKVVSGSVRECFREWFLVQRLQKKAFGTISFPNANSRLKLSVEIFQSLEMKLRWQIWCNRATAVN